MTGNYSLRVTVRRHRWFPRRYLVPQNLHVNNSFAVAESIVSNRQLFSLMIQSIVTRNDELKAQLRSKADNLDKEHDTLGFVSRNLRKRYLPIAKELELAKDYARSIDCSQCISDLDVLDASFNINRLNSCWESESVLEIGFNVCRRSLMLIGLPF
jgi:hypothetical protein